MNPEGEIYKAPEDEIPETDKARLDGYLHAKAEETELKRAEQAFKDLLAKYKESHA